MLVTSNGIDIEINRKQVCHYVGYGADYKLSARISSLINEYVENAYHLIEPSYSCVIRDIKLVKGSIAVIEGSIIFQSEVIARLLEQCHKAAVFLVTIGKHLEEMACLLAEDGLILQAAVLDAIGSVAVEKVADFVQSKVGEVANAYGLVTSRRFSPGYCDWDIAQQKTVFLAVGGEAMGICLTERWLMIPQKSVSGIIGIGPADSNVENYNPCKSCNKYDCPGRR
ncbi:hypothetical protein M1N58_01605 [Dehalococcoidales bacterium]|nr:hypothetical protein [Dehalococcoidales bacterium]